MRLGRMLYLVSLISLASLQFAGHAFANVKLQITLRDGGIAPASFSATKGEPVNLTIHNAGTKVHNMVIPDFYIFTYNLNPKENVTVSFTPDKTGNFPYYSDAGGKPEAGMRGVLHVHSS